MGHSSELRPYQLEALQEISEAFLERRVNKQLLVLPTGTGKTVVFAHLLRHPSIAAWLAQFPPRERRVLILAHREELLEQAKATLARINPELRVSIEQGARNVAEDCDVVVASVQTIGRRGTDRLQRLGSGRFRIVIVDEAHHAPARTYLNVLEHFAPDAGHEASSSARLILGVTATPERADDVGLACAFDEIVYAKSLREMIDSGYLCRLRAFRIETSERAVSTILRQPGSAIYCSNSTVRVSAVD